MSEPEMPRYPIKGKFAKGAAIRRGQRVWIKPGYQDPGDDGYEWYAIEDEDGGRVKVRQQKPGGGLLDSAHSVMLVSWLDTSGPPAKGGK